MTSKTGPVRTPPRGGWDELKDLYFKILGAFYERSDRKGALRYEKRFRELLGDLASGHESIFGEECWSLLHELNGDLPGAIASRGHEIDLILRLWEISVNTAAMPRVLRENGVEDLTDRYDLLAILYHDSGDLDRAILTLTRSKWLCESFKVPFDSEDLLQEYLYEKNVNSSLMRALEKQGWKLSGEGHATNAERDDPPRRDRPARLRRRGARG
jgi:hypothetical protein